MFRFNDINASPQGSGSPAGATQQSPQKQVTPKRAKLRRLEQERRCRETMIGQIDLNMQSDLMESVYVVTPAQISRIDDIKASPQGSGSSAGATQQSPQDQVAPKHAELRRLEQERRRREAMIGQIDLNMQSDLMESVYVVTPAQISRVDDIKASPQGSGSSASATQQSPQDQVAPKYAELRRLDQERRRREAMSSQVDMSRQSELMAAFEEAFFFDCCPLTIKFLDCCETPIYEE